MHCDIKLILTSNIVLSQITTIDDFKHDDSNFVVLKLDVGEEEDYDNDDDDEDDGVRLIKMTNLMIMNMILMMMLVVLVSY